ncbi:amino acid adenylation domain-containing protein [Nocardia blacklockiae]|uniref:amino acid adenylation domain-containing protein n=1 Tax=Nocardia blacklockiae TaxID=480036 RepID=UPI0018958964|nr:amino acid adenylation domain-containing protein [Nocardia blacklockiae]MBF6175773.1 amino acid adenylation domain-containing protein [Nocardia blacklockiae]
MNGPARDGVLPDLLARCAEVPDRTAVVVGDRALTYGELDSATAELAGRLVAAGLRPGRVAVIRMRQRLETVVAMLAALRAGGAWCVVEPGYPAEWLRVLLRDIDCAAVVFDGGELPGIAAETTAAAPRGVGVVDVGSGGAVAPVPGPVPENAPAYVITTSGSTGAPKAVVVSRSNLANLAASRDYPVPDGGPVALAPLRLTWDGALIQSVWTLCLGGTVVLPDHRGLPDPQAVAELARERRCTHLCATPSFYRLLLPYLAGADEHLGTVVLAGEVLSPDLARRHRAVLPGTTLINEYGPTEATGTVLAHQVSAEERVVPIGRPLGDSTAYLLTERLAGAAPEVSAALALGGPQVADGYAARPGDTAARFVADPFAATPGSRMYLTGDSAMRDPHGDLIFQGRTDGQVKVRGVRVECEAVAEVLRRHPGVRDAAVFAVPDRHGDQRLAACWTAGESTVLLPTTAELVAHCGAHLPAYAVPERMVQVGSLPLAASGKTDLAALRALLADAAQRENAARRQHWSAPQQAVAALWAEVLDHDDFDLDDPFLVVGGNSQRVVELHIRLERRWPGAVRVGQLFDAATVRAQAELVEGAPRSEPVAASRPIAFEL